MRTETLELATVFNDGQRTLVCNLSLVNYLLFTRHRDKYDDIYYKMMTNEFEVETKAEIKSDTEKGLENAGDKIKAGAKAVANKIKDPDRDLGTEYDKEKVKEKVN